MFKLTCISLLVVAGLCAQPAVLTTGIVGIADGQTAQVNVLNPGVQAPALGVLCSAAVVFVDDTGNVLKSATFSIPPGQSKSLQLRSDTDLNLTVQGDRRQIRAMVASPSFAPATPNAAACRLAPTLEVLDTTSGKTEVVLTQVTAVPGVVAPPAARNP
ncbi:MAG TPA: hypothetical protein VKX49_15620 [Bryobacteraceae bacterium]|nr:hypothetical protein [Bryobacteraceae bacterium]